MVFEVALFCALGARLPWSKALRAPKRETAQLLALEGQLSKLLEQAPTRMLARPSLD